LPLGYGIARSRTFAKLELLTAEKPARPRILLGVGPVGSRGFLGFVTEYNFP
jgi:hypothetical protein